MISQEQIMDYPLTKEQLNKIKTFLANTPTTMFYGRIDEAYQEVFDFLIYHRFIANSSMFAYNVEHSSNQFYRVTTNSEILRQIINENTRILEERKKAERAEKRNSRTSISTFAISILTLLATIASIFL